MTQLQVMASLAEREGFRGKVQSSTSAPLRDQVQQQFPDLLADSGCIFVQIGDENVHRVRAVMDELGRTTSSVQSLCKRPVTQRQIPYPIFSTKFFVTQRRYHR